MQDQPLVLTGCRRHLCLEREREFADEWLDVVIIPAELLTNATLVEVREFGHFGGGELHDFAFGAL